MLILFLGRSKWWKVQKVDATKKSKETFPLQELVEEEGDEEAAVDEVLVALETERGGGRVPRMRAQREGNERG